MRRSTLAFALALSLVATFAVSPVAIGATPIDTAELRDAVTVDGVRDHQEAFQQHADDNNGTRQSGDPDSGYEESVAYVADVAEAAGYDVTIQEFEFPFFQLVGTPDFEQVTPSAIAYVDQTDFDVMRFSGAGATGTVEFVGVDLSLGDPAASTSGCEAADFDDVVVTGKIAVMQRGFCAFAAKAANAEAAGAAGAVIFNQGDTPDREGLFFGTLGAPGINIPVVSTTTAIGTELSAGSATGFLDVDTVSETRSSKNVIADSPGGRDDRVVVVGAHLDSVDTGPGVQDNGSGSAAILEIAVQMAALEIEPRNKVRFAWWGAEEAGLQGSFAYVNSLSKREIKNIALNLNFDMIGSPNFVRFVYDGDGSDTGVPGPNGSGNIEQVFLDYFATQGLEGLKTEPTVMGSRSDHAAFVAAGIPAGGLFTGAEGIKTAEQVEDYGGTEGDQYDPCYHLACDTFDNISLEALDQMSDAAAHAVLTFAETTSAVNGTGKASARATKSDDFFGSKAQK
jgi:Zn-dependent M28 family amino/carboxypeptidase